MTSLHKRIAKTFSRKQTAESSSQSIETKPLRLRGGCISTRSLDDPTSKHYNPHYSQSGFEMWGSTIGNRLESMGRTISRGGGHAAAQIIHHHHHHYHHHDSTGPQPQHLYKGFGGGAVEGFEHHSSDRASGSKK